MLSQLRKIVISLSVFIIPKLTFADNYQAALDSISGSNTAVIVVDMFQNDTIQLPGFPSTARSISAITEQISSQGGLIICVIERINKRDGRHCPEHVIPLSARKTEEGRRFTTITKDQLSAFHHTGLMTTLHRNNITQLIIVGAYSDLCIKETTADALNNGFNVTLFFSAITTMTGSIVSTLPHYTATDISLTEQEDFFGLVDSLRSLCNWEKLTVICAPSRNSHRRDRFDPPGGTDLIKTGSSSFLTQ